MIKQVEYGETQFSQLNVPNKKSLMEQVIDCSSECKINGHNISLMIIASFVMKDFQSHSEHEILKSQTTYEIITNGTISINELYEIYHHAMSALINHLTLSKSGESHTWTEGVHPKSIKELSGQMQYIIDHLHQA